MRIAVPLTVVVSVLAFVSAVLGQAREITEAELTNLKTISAEKQKGLPRRQKTTISTGSETIVESLVEFGSSDTYHYSTLRRADGVETKNEGIRIGPISYRRLQDGTWIKEPPPRGLGGTGSGSGYGGSTASSPPEITEHYLYVGSDKINGQQAAHYRMTRLIKFASPVLVRNVVDDYWFRDDGLVVKDIHENITGSSKSDYKNVTEYDYDKDIKIKAPIPD